MENKQNGESRAVSDRATETQNKTVGCEAKDFFHGSTIVETQNADVSVESLKIENALLKKQIAHLEQYGTPSEDGDLCEEHLGDDPVFPKGDC